MNDLQRSRFADALRRVAGDEEMLTTLAEIVAEDAPPMLDKLAEQIESAELTDASKTAHSLGGLLSGFETDAPVSDIHLLIGLLRSGDQIQSDNVFDSLRPRLDHLIGEISEVSCG